MEIGADFICTDYPLEVMKARDEWMNAQLKNRAFMSPNCNTSMNDDTKSLMTMCSETELMDVNMFSPIRIAE